MPILICGIVAVGRKDKSTHYKKTVYGQPEAKSGMLILKVVPLPEDILTLGIDGVNQIWRDAKVRAVGKARANIDIDYEKTFLAPKKFS